MIKRIKIKNPITQEFVGTFGTYTQQNMEKQRSYNLPEWKALTEETHHQPPAKRGERRRNQEKVTRGGGSLRARASIAGATKEDDNPSKAKKKPGRPRRNASTAGEDPDVKSAAAPGARSGAPPTPASPAESDRKDKAPKRRGRPTGNGQNRSVTSRRLNNTAEAAEWVDESAFEKFDYRMDGLDEFTPERCAELETHYWKGLGFNQPMYAADMPGSLFDDKTNSWNVSKLENLLDVLGTKVPGVNTAYLYLGMWKATFAWHLEDVDLYSINYIHFGAPKQWYSISQEDARRFEAAMKNIWPADSKNCDQFLRHKTYLISPDVLQKQYNVKVNKLVHYEGEFVITYPYGYHSGYNLGYNCAESVNFATESWLEYGRIARKCNCEADNVWVDVGEVERKMRGEPTPEYYEETDDDDDDDLDDDDDSKLPTPPASVKGQKTPSRKRKRGDKKEAPKKKKIRIRVKGATREPCVMCPNDCPWEPLLPTDNGKSAHRSCALYTPETWIASDNGIERVYGVTTIDRARLELKCNFCRSKRGACFQCSSKKCTRAFHATCALASGVQVDCGAVPTFGEDGTEYFETGYDFRCRFHRPKAPKHVSVETLENSKRVMNYAKELRYKDVVQAQLVGGEIFAGLVVETRPGEQSVVVDVLPEGYVNRTSDRGTSLADTCLSDRIEVEWKYLAVLDPDESQRPKPSPNAIAMPEGMNKQSVSIGNRQDGVPAQDQTFTDNSAYRWQEFVNVDMPPAGYKLNKFESMRFTVNFEEPEQIFYYLPETSTEARCFFTDQANGTEHNPRSTFLDRVKPKPTPAYQQQRHSLAASHPSAQPQRQIFSAATMAPKGSDKPYKYKPRHAPSPHMFAIDHQALANQRSFAAQAGRQASFTSQGSPPAAANNSTPRSQQSGSGTPLRAFPSDQYYSHIVLPAAYPGEYSGFIREVKRQSQDAQSLPRPDFAGVGPVSDYRPVFAENGQSMQASPALQSAPTVPRMGGGQLQPAFGSEIEHDIRPVPPPTNEGSPGSLNEGARRANAQWTPPSQRPSATLYKTTPPLQTDDESSRYHPPTYQSAAEFQHGLVGPSIASREGAHLRMMRDKGYAPSSGGVAPQFLRNSFGQPYDGAPMWQSSPKAPLASPLSDLNTSGFQRIAQAAGNQRVRDLPSMPLASQMGNPAEGAMPGPFLPQMESANGGNETWRYDWSDGG